MREERWGVGETLERVTREEVDALVDGGEEELVQELVRRRREEEQVAGVHRLREHRLVSDKSSADCVEAAIGCHLLHGGPPAALAFMARAGLGLGSAASTADLFARRPSEEPVLPFTPQASALCVRRTEAVEARLARLLERLDVAAIEEVVGYTWRDRSFLLQAFTHPSYSDNRVTESYERLELLGDAVLDYLVTCHIYTATDADPGRLTDTRAALINNNYFASLLTDLGLDTHILHSAPGVHRKVMAYLADRWWDADLSTIHGNIGLLNETETEVELVEVPKVLGDVFEAIVGAVFVDCGHDLATVWRVYTGLCPALDQVVADPPLHMKKQLVERFPGLVTFGPAEVDEARGNVVVQVREVVLVLAGWELV